METAWPLLLFLAGLAVFGVLILLCGIWSHEEELDEAARADGRAAAAPPRSFFATIDAAFAVPAGVPSEVHRDIERHVRRQTELAVRFVECPTIDSLHDDDVPESDTVPSLFCRIQQYLELERQLAAEFVSDPTLARLHGQPRAMVV